MPYLPVSLFKWIELKSVPDEDVFKVMTSSGTTGQVPSRIYLDVETARAQTRALSSIVTHYTGPEAAAHADRRPPRGGEGPAATQRARRRASSAC